MHIHICFLRTHMWILLHIYMYILRFCCLLEISSSKCLSCEFSLYWYLRISHTDLHLDLHSNFPVMVKWNSTVFVFGSSLKVTHSSHELMNICQQSERLKHQMVYGLQLEVCLVTLMRLPHPACIVIQNNNTRTGVNKLLQRARKTT